MKDRVDAEVQLRWVVVSNTVAIIFNDSAHRAGDSIFCAMHILSNNILGGAARRSINLPMQCRYLGETRHSSFPEVIRVVFVLIPYHSFGTLIRKLKH